MKFRIIPRFCRAFDSLIPWVQIPPAQPSLQDKKYIQPTNGISKPIVGCITFVFENPDRCIFLKGGGD